MSDDRIHVVVRCKNEMPFAERTFQALDRPDLRVWVFDSGSTDGSRELAEKHGYQIVDIEPSAYVPGRVLNQAMEVTSGPIVAFVNADAIPLTEDAVKLLVEACAQGAAAAYGRQVPRPDAWDDTRRDYARAFPDKPQGPGFIHFFSMAASAIRREVWKKLPFDPALQYSEDIDWTWRLRAIGQRIAYVPGATFEHSHDYDNEGMRRRMRGEGRADRVIFHSGPPRLLRDVVRPLVGSTIRDVRGGLATKDVLSRRVIAQLGRYEGRDDLGGALRSRPVSDKLKVWRPEMKLTRVGTPEAEAVVREALEEAIELVKLRMAGRVEALLLIGGYASGEGTVDMVDGKPQIHNDVDLVVVAGSERKARALRGECEQVSAEASKRVGAAIDLYPVSVTELQDPKGKLIWVDAAVRGGLLLYGRESVLAPLRSLTSRSVDADEIGRLLVNRATGIALSRLAFEAQEQETHRAARHVAKMWFALGDALLIHVARFEGGYGERFANLANLTDVGADFIRQIHAGYARARAFRQDPSAHKTTAQQLEEQIPLMWTCFAELEAHRLGVRPWIDAFGYADERAPRFPHLSDVPPVGRYLAGVRAAIKGKVAWHRAAVHPREVLGRAATLLAFSPNLRSARAWVAPWLRTDDDPTHITRALEALREVGA